MSHVSTDPSWAARLSTVQQVSPTSILPKFPLTPILLSTSYFLHPVLLFPHPPFFDTDTSLFCNQLTNSVLPVLSACRYEQRPAFWSRFRHTSQLAVHTPYGTYTF